MASSAQDERTVSQMSVRRPSGVASKTPEQPRISRAYDRVLVVMDLMRSFGTLKDEGIQEGIRVISCEKHVSGVTGRVEFRARGDVYGARFSMEVGCPTAAERQAYDQCERNDFQLRAFSVNFDGVRLVQQSPVFQAAELAQVLTALDYVFGVC